MDLNQTLNQLTKQLTDKIVQDVTEQLGTVIASEINTRLAAHNYAHYVRESLQQILEKHEFAEGSIRARAINFEDFTISGSNVQGGIIENFSSTGIDDRATQVALTILDDTTVVENNLLTKDLTIQGSMIVNGEFVVNGSVPEDTEFFRKLVSSTTTSTLGSLDHTLFNQYSTLIFNKIKQEGLDLDKITLNGTEVAKSDSLGSSIVNSNLQKLGELKELQVGGEAVIAQTFYVTPKRVGINTIEPSAALSVWDDEIEIVAKKKSRDTGMLGTARQQKLVLTSNGKDNIILIEDGSAQIDDLRIGSMRFTTSNTPPNFVSERCHVVWNTNPNPGGPLGWVCVGGANWANFGIID